MKKKLTSLMKICITNGITTMEWLKMLKEYFKKSILSRTLVFEWQKAFTECSEVIENLSHVCRSSSSVNDDYIEKVKETELENRLVRLVPKEKRKRWHQYLSGSGSHLILSVFPKLYFFRNISQSLVEDD